MEEDLRPQKALVANIDGKWLLGDGINACVLFDPLGAICVVLIKLFHKVGADVAETFLKTEHTICKYFVKLGTCCKSACMSDVVWTMFHFCYVTYSSLKQSFYP